MINLIKFIHLIFALGLLGATTLCFVSAGRQRILLNLVIHRILLYALLIATITGTLLVYPKNFTFHTPWIQAAYLLILVYAGGILLLNRVRKISSEKYKKIITLIYFLLMLLLVFVIHDAVTKTTFLL